MPNLDIRSDLEPQLIMRHVFSGVETVASSIVDSADFDGGIMFTSEAPAFATGTYTFLIYESDLSTMTGDETEVPAEKIIDDITKLSPTALTAEGAILPAVGVFSTKRYLRVKVTSASTPDATIVMHAVKKAEYMPVTNQ